jgi:DNA-binding NarL/FixJ family response regulator
MSGIPLNFEGQTSGGAPGPRPDQLEPAAVAPARELKPVRVALVDDDAVVHQFLQHALKRIARTWTLDSYLGGRSALRNIPRRPPQVVLMDWQMPGMNGIACAKELKARLPELRIILFSAHIDDPDILQSAMMAGACGCLCKPAEPPDIVRAIQKVLTGSVTFCPRTEKTLMEVFRILGQEADDLQFTSREQEILDRLREGKSDKAIAELLQIAPGTVHTHMNSVFRKLNVHSRAEAIAKITGTTPPGARPQ